MAFDLKTFAPYLAASGTALINLDENTTGADDLSGELLIYVADVIQAVSEGGDLPGLPTIIAQGTQERITGAARVSLTVAASVLPIAQFQVPAGKGRTALKYAGQVINQLLAGKPVSAIPADLKKALQ